MSETKIIRTALDPTPESVSADRGDYDWKNDPHVLRKMKLAEPGIKAFIRQYGSPASLNEENK